MLKPEGPVIKAVIDSGKAEEISNNWFQRNMVIYEDL